jgi:hypothetical protein
MVVNENGKMLSIFLTFDICSGIYIILNWIKSLLIFSLSIVHLIAVERIIKKVKIGTSNFAIFHIYVSLAD